MKRLGWLIALLLGSGWVYQLATEHSSNQPVPATVVAPASAAPSSAEPAQPPASTPTAPAATYSPPDTYTPETKYTHSRTLRRQAGTPSSEELTPGATETGSESNGSEPGLSNNHSYRNSDGYQVHSPAYSNGGVPAGASALCADGTYSFSQHRQGTCSHHGGVSSWL